MISIIFLLLLGIIACFYLLIQQQKKKKILAENIAELKEVQEIKEIKSYLKGRDEERIRIAQDWHDGIGNSLATLRLIIDTIQPQNQERHTEALSLLEHTQREFRQIIDNELVNDFSNKANIVHVFRKWTQQLQFGNIELFFKVYDLNRYDNCQPIFKSYFYRIVQELLTNIIKHAKATQINVELREGKKGLYLRVADNGIGLRKAIEAERLMRSIHQRLMFLKGEMKLNTRENNGTKIEILLPFVDD